MADIDTAKVIEELKSFPSFLRNFILKPVKEMRSIPNYSWPTLLVIQLCFSLISGVLTGLLEMSIFATISGAILLPIVAIISSLLFTLFIYYFFYLFLSTELPFERLLAIIIIANIPFLLFHIGSGLLPLIDLLGYAFSSMLLIVGLVETFGLPKKFVARLILGIYVVFLVSWLINNVSGLQTPKPQPKLLDHIESEMN